MNLKDKLLEIAKEYSNKVSELLGLPEGYWVAEDICVNVCDFGDTMFLSLGDMQVIVEHYDKWLKKYGSNDKILDSVMNWFDCRIMENNCVNLYCWLDNPELMEEYKKKLN